MARIHRFHRVRGVALGSTDDQGHIEAEAGSDIGQRLDVTVPGCRSP